jgi:hypothetical protein
MNINQLVWNASEYIQKWGDFMLAPAGTVEVQYYDKDGTLKTALIPNRQKLVNDFIANARNVMLKWNIAIHETEGSDETGDGTLDRPYRTLRHVASIVPEGGVLGVRCLSNITLKSSESFSLGNKVVVLTCDENAGAVTTKFIIDKAGIPPLLLNFKSLLRIRTNIDVQNVVDTSRRVGIDCISHICQVQIDSLTELGEPTNISIGNNSCLGAFTMLEFMPSAKGNISLGENSAIATFWRGGIFKWNPAMTINGSSTYNISDYLGSIIRDADGKVINGRTLTRRFRMITLCINGQLLERVNIDEHPELQSIVQDEEKLKKALKGAIGMVTDLYIKRQLRSIDEDLSDITSEVQVIETKILYLAATDGVTISTDEVKQKVALFLAGTYTQESAISELSDKGFSEESIQRILSLLARAVEIARILNWKEEIWQKEGELEAQIDGMTLEELLQLDVKKLCQDAYAQIPLEVEGG